MANSRSGALLRWAASLALLLPVIALYACEFLRGDGRSFTGFIQYDQVSYMADARKFFDGGFHFFYGNPFSPDPQTPAIYFQIHLFVLGLVEKVTGWDPGAVYMLFGFVAGLVCVRVAMALYEEVAGLRTLAEGIGLVLFVWGGGILALMGVAYHVIFSVGQPILPDLFRFDPDDGWWFLNLGRNLVFPTEAYYHTLVLGMALMAMRRNFRAVIALGFVLFLSHPFTGLQFLLIFTVWAGLESVVLKNREVPFLFAGTMSCLLLLHLFYYVLLLNLFPEHRALFAQWSLAWNEPAATAVGADLVVGLLAVWALRKGGLLVRSSNRLLSTWFLLSLLLAHHDLFVHARQPLHFTRGYTWIALFLLGVGPLLRLLNAGMGPSRRPFRWGALAFILVVGLADNGVWLGSQMAGALAPRWGLTGLPDASLPLDPGVREVFQWLMARPAPHDELFVEANPDAQLPYLATAYTDYRGAYTHFASTPFAAQRRREIMDFIRAGRVPYGWQGRSVLVIVSKSREEVPPSVTQRSGIPVFEDDAYSIFRLKF
jgi:hypothetical protein